MATLPTFFERPAIAWRPLREEDASYVAALEAQIHAAPWTIGNFRDSLASGYLACVGERDGRILVYGVLMLAPGEAQLLNLSVAPDARRTGLGRALLRRFLDDARRLGAEQMFLEVRPSNVAAIALYESEGFVRIARRDEYYPAAAPGDRREDALVLRRALAHTAPHIVTFGPTHGSA
jgi:[ribosomal protein S18]-alanine N-acetyltransferase